MAVSENGDVLVLIIVTTTVVYPHSWPLPNIIENHWKIEAVPLDFQTNPGHSKCCAGCDLSPGHCLWESSCWRASLSSDRSSLRAPPTTTMGGFVHSNDTMGEGRYCQYRPLILMWRPSYWSGFETPNWEKVSDLHLSLLRGEHTFAGPSSSSWAWIEYLVLPGSRNMVELFAGSLVDILKTNDLGTCKKLSNVAGFRIAPFPSEVQAWKVSWQIYIAAVQIEHFSQAIFLKLSGSSNWTSPNHWKVIL